MPKHWGPWFVRDLGFALGSFALGLLVRWPLQPLMGTKLIWLTFYPFIMVSALLGGVWSGALAALFSAAFAIGGWPLLSPQPFVRDLADWVGVGVFLLNAVLITAVSEVLRRANVRSKAAQRQAEEANRAKSVFLAQMSHELRTPFHALMGFTNLLASAPETTPHQKELLTVVDRNARHLLDLINNVLDMSRLEAGADRVESKPILIRELVGDVVELITPRASARGLVLKTTVDPGTPERVLGDGRKLRQILVNLMGNAVKFSARGTVTVGLETEFRSEAPWLRLWVQDEGPGIAPQDLETIFEPFRQLDSEEAKEGTGLGLAIVRQFAQAMGGKVSVESIPGRGSRFTVIFPAPPAPGAVFPSAASVGFRHWTPAPGQEGHRFLIVDDQEDNRRLLEVVHRDLKQDVRLAENGEQAVALFREWNPELIWMDIRMPKMDGPTAVRKIRALPGGAAVKIVAVTASVFREELDSYRGIGFDEVLTKPFPPERVAELMGRLLGLNFEATPVGEAASPVEPARPDFAGLEAGDRTRLLQALESLDPETIDACVFRLQQHEPVLAEAIRVSIEKLDYAALRAGLMDSDLAGKAP